MGGVVHFEVHVDDVERAKAFYAAVFDWTFIDYSHMVDAPYWGIVTGPDETPGINGGLLKRSGPAPAPDQEPNAFVCTVGVADFDETEERIITAGGIVAMPKVALTGMAWQGYFIDTEGNTFGIHQPDPNAR